MPIMPHSYSLSHVIIKWLLIRSLTKVSALASMKRVSYLFIVLLHRGTRMPSSYQLNLAVVPWYEFFSCVREIWGNIYHMFLLEHRQNSVTK